VNWVTTETGHRCRLHGTAFSRGDVCEHCVNDPGPSPTSAIEHSDSDLAAIVGKCMSRAESLWTYYESHINGDDAGLAIKATSEHTKLMRLALEYADRRESRELDRELLAHEREMAGLRNPN
jgi:hypothetical protein